MNSYMANKNVSVIETSNENVSYNICKRVNSQKPPIIKDISVVKYNFTSQ